MRDKTFYWSVPILVAIVFGLIYLGESNPSLTLLSTLLTAVVGITSGIWISSHFSRKSSEINLGRSASSGFRTSVSLYDSLGDCMEEIDRLRSEVSDREKSSEHDVNLMLRSVQGMLKIVQRSALAANDNWRDLLQEDDLTELVKRERFIDDISENHQLETTKEVHSIKALSGKSHKR